MVGKMSTGVKTGKLAAGYGIGVVYSPYNIECLHTAGGPETRPWKKR